MDQVALEHQPVQASQMALGPPSHRLLLEIREFLDHLSSLVILGLHPFLANQAHLVGLPVQAVQLGRAILDHQKGQLFLVDHHDPVALKHPSLPENQQSHRHLEDPGLLLDLENQMDLALQALL